MAGLLGVCAAGLLLGIVLVRTAWVCDDAFFTFRTVDNLLSGYGPRWNVIERVQSYSHPAWFLLLAVTSAVLGGPIRASMFLGLALSLAAWLVIVRKRITGVAVLAGLVLACSKAWTDFATSGLENALSYVLVGLAFVSSRRPDPGPRLSLVAGLLVLNRLDLVLLIGPLVLLGALASRRSRVSCFVLFLAPIGLWSLFSLLYYGSLLPNPALVKLGVGASRATLLQHGGWYLVQSLQLDWVTLPVLTLGVVHGLRRPGPTRALAIGVVLYLAYVVWIGGDFMSGRFLAVPLFAAVAILSRLLQDAKVLTPSRTAVAATAIFLGGVLSPASSILSGPSYGDPDSLAARRSPARRLGVADERAFYFQATGLVAYGTHEPLVRESSPRVEVGVGGLAPFEAGPMLHRIDAQALPDAFLARMAPDPGALVGFRAGHLPRPLPTTYLDYVRHQARPGQAGDISALLLDVELATRSPILATGRFAAITRLALRDLRKLLGVDAGVPCHGCEDSVPPPRPPPAVEGDRCPPNMVLIGAGALQLGETDPENWVAYRPNTLVLARSYTLRAYCIDRLPLPGRAGAPWPRTGITRNEIEAVEQSLWRHGRRLCSVAELLRAAAGPGNSRFPWTPAPTPPCDPSDDAPAPLGTHQGCVTSEGVRDFGVRSSWARMDPITHAMLIEEGAGTQPGFDADYVVWGGLVRTDTYYPPTNFSVHFHDPGGGGIDDALRSCSWLRTSDGDEEWRSLMDRMEATGGFDALIESGGP